MQVATDAFSQEPDLTVGGFSLWVLGRVAPEATDFWEGNWLRVKALMVANGARVEVEGPIVRGPELEGFAAGLRNMIRTLSGEARLDCLEPNLSLVLRLDSLGHVSGSVSITPDELYQRHAFDWGGLDQTYLGPLLQSCEVILERYPVTGSPDD
jgi:hypothetical protein